MLGNILDASRRTHNAYINISRVSPVTFRSSLVMKVTFNQLGLNLGHFFQSHVYTVSSASKLLIHVFDSIEQEFDTGQWCQKSGANIAMGCKTVQLHNVFFGFLDFIYKSEHSI